MVANSALRRWFEMSTIRCGPRVARTISTRNCGNAMSVGKPANERAATPTNARLATSKAPTTSAD
jgi:hypothetical protein